jgi:CubicO group peptidase (beta-lactamase class C family)
MKKRPASSVELGLMRGSPPPQERMVTSDNWIEGPFNRWGFLHVRELARTARIRRGQGPVRELTQAPRDDVAGVPVTFEGSTMPMRQALEQTYTDAVVVLQDGRIVFEHYVEGMTRHDTHLLMSVSKSLTATLVGVLVGQGVLDPAAQVTHYIQALRGTAWEGCTLQHLLDMRAGTRFDEDDYADPDSDGVVLEYVSGYRPNPRPAELPTDTYQWIRQLDNDREHGSAFKYRSILTDVLAWAAMEATGRRFPDLFADLIWTRIGAEHDADIIVDAAGFPIVEGGICTTARDLARFGLMHLQDGRVGDTQVVPPEWIGRLLTRDDDLIAAFEEEEMFADLPNACYHDQWWIWDAEQGIYSGYGINGQQLLVHRPGNLVVARLSTWPDRWSRHWSASSDACTRALVDHLTR